MNKIYFHVELAFELLLESSRNISIHVITIVKDREHFAHTRAHISFRWIMVNCSFGFNLRLYVLQLNLLNTRWLELENEMKWEISQLAVHFTTVVASLPLIYTLLFFSMTMAFFFVIYFFLNHFFASIMILYYKKWHSFFLYSQFHEYYY